MIEAVVVPGRTAALAAGANFDCPDMPINVCGGQQISIAFPATSVGADFTILLQLLNAANGAIALDTNKKIMAARFVTTMAAVQAAGMVDLAAGAVSMTGSGGAAGYGWLVLDAGQLGQYDGVAKIRWRVTLPAGATGPKNIGAAVVLTDYRDTERFLRSVLPTPT